MSKTIHTFATINSLLRTLLALAVVGALGYAGWFAYDTYSEQDNQSRALADTRAELDVMQTKLAETRSELDRKAVELTERLREIDALKKDVEQKQAEITRLDTSLRLLKVSHRLARLTVVNQETDPQSGELYSTVDFVELSPQGEPIGEPKRFRIRGDVIYLDNWVVKFEDKYVERADIDRSTSLVLFRRIFGEYQEPSQGYPLDEIGGRPLAYGRGGEITEFEQQIWDDFWSIANNERRAAELGIRAAHGEAPSIKVQPGKSYKILLRASDGLTISPDPDAPAVPGASL